MYLVHAGDSGGQKTSSPLGTGVQTAVSCRVGTNPGTPHTQPTFNQEPSPVPLPWFFETRSHYIDQVGLKLFSYNLQKRSLVLFLLPYVYVWVSLWGYVHVQEGVH